MRLTPSDREPFHPCAGRSLGALASGGKSLRIYRKGRTNGFREAETVRLEMGDTVVEIRTTTESA